MKKDSSREKRSTETTMDGMKLKIFPINPGTKKRGLKAAIVVRMEKETGFAICWAPTMAAFRGGRPS